MVFSFTLYVLALALVALGLTSGLFLLRHSVGLWQANTDKRTLYNMFLTCTIGGIILFMIVHFNRW